MKIIVVVFLSVWEILYLPILVFFAIISRFFERRFHVGLGPEPLINNKYHKKALEEYGYVVETFVTSFYYITSCFDKKFIFNNKVARIFFLNMIFLDFIYAIFSYKAIYVYFNGGPLFRSQNIWRIEPFLFKIAGVKVVVMPYGGDVQVANYTQNLYFRHCLAMDYPEHRIMYNKIKDRLYLWTANASHVVSGCDWVDYMYHWDTLMVGHFAIDLDLYSSIEKKSCEFGKVFTILHAPNHRNLKGTKFIIDAVDDLKKNGYSINLIVAEKKSNEEILLLINAADLIIDQLVIGWYAMFSIEAMAVKKPVMCYLRDDLIHLYRVAGLLAEQDPPLINTSPLTFKNDLRRILDDKSILSGYGERGYCYVERLHSTRSVGFVFDKINKKIGISC